MINSSIIHQVCMKDFLLLQHFPHFCCQMCVVHSHWMTTALRISPAISSKHDTEICYQFQCPSQEYMQHKPCWLLCLQHFIQQQSMLFSKYRSSLAYLQLIPHNNFFKHHSLSQSVEWIYVWPYLKLGCILCFSLCILDSHMYEAFI